MKELIIQQLENDIKLKQIQIELVNNINPNEIVNEKKWHEICETPLRADSEILTQLVKNIFNNASNIIVGANYIIFTLHGFKCYLPKYRVNGIEIDTDWYKKDGGIPKKYTTQTNYYMKKYFDALDNKESWKILFNYRFPSKNNYRVWLKFILWFGRYKWKNVHRESWEEVFRKDKLTHERNVLLYENKRIEMHEMATKMKDTLIPELNKFTDKIRKYTGSYYGIDDILKMEELE